MSRRWSDRIRRLAVLTLLGASLSVGAASASKGPVEKSAAKGVDGNSLFVPESFTAISEDVYWVLGESPCSGRRCLSILRTTDDGRSFVRIHAPPLETRGEVPILRFANRLDGFALALTPGLGGVLYATHDGGISWHRLPLRRVLAFATAGSHPYAISARCTVRGCAGYRFERSPVSADAWRARAMPFEPDGAIVDLVAHDTHVWLLGTPASGMTQQSDALARSSDAGRSFVTGVGPCYPGLGGELAPISAAVIWAVCPTGLMASVSRATDGGVRFLHVDTPPLVNSAKLAPASRNTAVLAANGAGFRLRRTTNGGVSWTRPELPASPVLVTWMGFTDARFGAALVQTRAGAQASRIVQELWRTRDGGAHWFRVHFG